MADTQQSSGASLDGLLAVAGAATTLVTTVSALAVTGALQQMQRDHGVILVIALACVLAAAATWTVVALYSPAAMDDTESLSVADRISAVHADGNLTDDEKKQKELALVKALRESKGGSQNWRTRAVWLARGGAVLGFAAGIALGLWGMVTTQQERERPSIVASLDPAKLVLSGTAEADNLGTEGRLLTQINGLVKTSAPHKYTVDRQYYAITGPGSDGTAKQAFSYAIPKGRFAAVVVAATTSDQTNCIPGQTASGTTLVQVAQHNLPGCAFFYLP